MDDFLGGAQTEEDALQLQKVITHIHASGGFQIMKWNSSSSAVVDKIPEEIRSKENVNLNSKDDICMDKTLGLLWNPREDVFQVRVNLSKVPADVVSRKRRPTKREILGITMALFDPLGFILPVKITALMILQHAWRSGLEWDQELENGLGERWDSWFESLPSLMKIKVPRLMTNLNIYESEVQMHVFCDSSEDAFASCILFRFHTGESTEVAFVTGRARVAPLKTLSIPRLELQAAVMGSRLAQSVKKAFGDDLKICRTVYWTDSKTVLCWLRSTSIRYNQFVANRIGEIQELSNTSEWKWVPTKENVADDATRFTTAEFSAESRWLCGPKFLLEDENTWPKEAADMKPECSEKELEAKKVFFVAAEVEEEKSLPEINRFSSWLRLIRATAAVKVAARRFQKKMPYEITVADMKAGHVD